MTSLLAPVSSFESAVKVISKGANEIYCGVECPVRSRSPDCDDSSQDLGFG